MISGQDGRKWLRYSPVFLFIIIGAIAYIHPSGSNAFITYDHPSEIHPQLVSEARKQKRCISSPKD